MSQSLNRVVVVAFLLCCTKMLSAEMMFQSSERLIQGYGTQLDESTRSTIGTAPFVDDLLSSGYVRDESNSITGSVSAFASQSSTLSENQIRGLARGSGFGSGADVEGVGISSMTVDFDIDQDMRFTLVGQLRLAPHGDDIGLADSMAFLRLVGPNGVAMEVRLDADNPPNNLGIVDFTKDNRISDIFPEGSYTLEAYAKGHGSEGKTRCVDFDFTLTALNAVAVPEPSTQGLFLVALAGALAIRRRRLNEVGAR